MSLYEGAVKKPIMTSLCFLAVAIVGLFSVSKLPVDLYPDICLLYTSYGSIIIKLKDWEERSMMQNSDIVVGTLFMRAQKIIKMCIRDRLKTVLTTLGELICWTNLEYSKERRL